MTDRFWPILDLDEGATESEIRRAYAKRLREQGPDADIASFQALRAEFEEALAASRGDARAPMPARMTSDPRDLSTYQIVFEDLGWLDDVHHRSADAHQPPEPHPRNAYGPAELPAFDEASRVAARDIRQFLAAGDLAGACDRFDIARASSEIDLAEESELERELARNWLTNATLDLPALTAIVRRYRWDDVDFPLGQDIIARLHAPVVRAPKPGERFAGKWNWGAGLLTPFWLMAHGLVRRGIVILIVGTIALLTPLAPIAALWIALFFGFCGNAFAAKHRTFESEAQFIAVQNAWRNRAFILYATFFVCAVIAVALIGISSHEPR